MGSRVLIVLGVAVAALLVGGGAVFGYDRAQQDKIADGVRVNGVAVGGMTPSQATRALRAALLAPLNRAVRVRHRGRTFTLTPREAAVAVDIEGSVARAMERTRDGNLFGRAWRELRGAPLRADVPARVSWSRPAIRRLVARVRRAIDRPAVSASVDLASGHVDPKPSRTGVKVRAAWLARTVETRLLDPTQRRPLVRVRTSTVKPRVTMAQLEAKYPAVIVVNRGAFRLTLYKHLKPAETFGIAVGRVGLETPAGLYSIQNKAVDPAWQVPNSAWAGALAGKLIPPGAPDNPIKARWMGIAAGAGIHGTADDGSIGSAASHGCIRMHIPDVKHLYDEVQVGAPVYIS